VRGCDHDTPWNIGQKADPSPPDDFQIKFRQPAEQAAEKRTLEHGSGHGNSSHHPGKEKTKLATNIGTDHLSSAIPQAFFARPI
jgi:hypothetical protein